MTRRRVMLVSCLLGGIALGCYGLYRWPLEYRKSGFVFVGDSARSDRRVATADFVASALLLAAGPWFRFGRIPRLAGGDQRPDAQVLDLLAIGSCVLGGLLMILISIGAVVSMTRS